MNLSNQDKVNLLKFEQGFLSLYKIDEYADKIFISSDNPDSPINVLLAKSIKEYDELRDLVSNVLGWKSIKSSKRFGED